MKVYMVAFTSKDGKINRQHIQTFLDTRSEVLNWYGIMPLTLLVTLGADSQVVDLSLMLRAEFGDNLTFIATEIDTFKTDGLISSDVWDFINSPKSSKR